MNAAHWPLVPAQAGTQFSIEKMDSRLRGNERRMRQALVEDYPTGDTLTAVSSFWRPEPNTTPSRGETSA